jgi:4-amino-4-deoxy-L-arabinose transferase-like glycosyltransferase
MLLAMVMVLATALSLRAGLAIARYAGYPPDFDEAVHALPALQIARDVQTLRLGDFLRHSFEQESLARYPFFHSWLLAPFFILARPDISVARASGLVFVVLSAVLLYGLGRSLSDDEARRPLAGLAAAALMLASMPVWIFAGTVLLEPAGLMVTLAWLYAYGRAGPGQPGIAWPAAASAAAAIVFFTKYSFGVFVVATMIGSECLALAAGPRRPGWRRWLGLFGPLALCLGLWFAMPGKLEPFISYSQAQPAQVDFWSAANLLYYPSVLFGQYANGPVTALLGVTGLVLALRGAGHRGRILSLYLLCGIFFLTLVPQKESRFGYTVLPAVFPLAGLALVNAIGWVSRRRWSRLGRASAWLMIGIALILEGLLAVRRHALFFDYAMETTFHSSLDTARAYQFIIAATLARGEPPHLLNQWYLFNTQALAWEYYSTQGGDLAAFQYLMTTGGEAPEPTPENQIRFVERLREQATPVVVSIDGSPAGPHTGWQIVEPLITSGHLEMLGASPRYTLLEWPTEYRQRVLGGNFSSTAALEQAREAARVPFTVQLHLYRLR